MPAVRYKTRECPCCGAPGQVKTVNTPHSHGWVGCTVCGLYIQWNWDPKDALEKWNRRAVDVAEVVRCRDCEHGEYAGLEYLCRLHSSHIEEVNYTEYNSAEWYCADGIPREATP